MAERASIAYMGTLVRNGACFHTSVGKFLTVNHAQAAAPVSPSPLDPRPNLVSFLA